MKDTYVKIMLFDLFLCLCFLASFLGIASLANAEEDTKFQVISFDWIEPEIKGLFHLRLHCQIPANAYPVRNEHGTLEWPVNKDKVPFIIKCTKGKFETSDMQDKIYLPLSFYPKETE